MIVGKLKNLILSASVAVAALSWPAMAAEALTNEAAANAIVEAYAAIHAGRPADAIASAEPVIAGFDAMLADGPYACAETTDQAEAVASLQTGKDVGRVKIVNIAFCSGYFTKGFALIDLGRGDEALEWLQRAHDHAPLHADFTNELAEWYKAHRDWEKAFALFNEASNAADYADEVSRDRYKARAWRGMGYSRIETGDLNAAETLFKASLKLEPDSQAAKSELEYIASLRRKTS